jgi:radical SAM superfamily enzyme
VDGFWPVEETADLADGPTRGGEVARGGCLFAWNFSVRRWREGTRRNMTQNTKIHYVGRT